MINDKISIIVPIYNIKNYISSTVESILNQTYENIEVILVDDGSTDGSGEMIDNIAKTDKRVKVIHKENGGVTRARMEGIKSATGEWIGFVDGDDFVEPDMFEMLISNAKRYDADISHCGYQMVFPSRIDYYYNTKRIIEQDNLTGLKDLIEGKFIEPGLWNKIYKTDLFKCLLENDLMDYSIKNFEDLLMNYYLFKNAKKSIYYDVCPYHYVLREGSAATSKSNEHKLLDPLKVYKIILSNTDNQLELKRIIKIRIIRNLIYLSTMFCGEQKELIKPIRKKARKELKQMRPEIIKGLFSSRLKIESFIVSVFPMFYACVHKIYSKIKGTDKKYQVR